MRENPLYFWVDDAVFIATEAELSKSNNFEKIKGHPCVDDRYEEGSSGRYGSFARDGKFPWIDCNWNDLPGAFRMQLLIRGIS
jgi:hypothetical protein